jgi:isopentenyl-diphosphate delta-isomerase
MKQEVVLVDQQDKEIGWMEKMEAHQKALLHRALSIFIFNSNGDMLLQQRAFSKYHSGGLWTNACCSHPQPNEKVATAALRRLEEELGFTTELQKAFEFTYKAVLDNGLTEYEYDHVFVGQYEKEVKMNPEEVHNYCFKSVTEIKNDLLQFPDKFTVWFHIAFPKMEEWLQHNKLNLS